MQVVVIGSGSKGNSTFIQTSKTKILIDAGISMRQIKGRLEEYNLNLDNLNAVFITHEHGDHTKYLVSILNKNPGCELYIHEKTYLETEKKVGTSLKNYHTHFLKANTRYTINDLDVVPITLSHDVVNCFGYLIREFNNTTNQNLTFGTLTDTGFIPKEYYQVLSKMHTLLVESNHDIRMLKTSTRPIDVIERILSNHGHMNNVDTARFLKTIANESLKQVILGHISEDCNEPQIAINEINKVFDNQVPFELYTACQHQAMYFKIGEDHD